MNFHIAARRSRGEGQNSRRDRFIDDGVGAELKLQSQCDTESELQVEERNRETKKP
jgi:hypothetical protein